MYTRSRNGLTFVSALSFLVCKTLRFVRVWGNAGCFQWYSFGDWSTCRYEQKVDVFRLIFDLLVRFKHYHETVDDVYGTEHHWTSLSTIYLVRSNIFEDQTINWQMLIQGGRETKLRTGFQVSYVIHIRVGCHAVYNSCSLQQLFEDTFTAWVSVIDSSSPRYLAVKVFKRSI